MDDHRAASLGSELLRALIFDPAAGARGWLVPLLRAVRDATGADVVYFGEPTERGYARHALVENRLVSRRHARLRGFARELASGGPLRIEPEIGRGSLFFPAVDGWEGVRARAFAGAPVPGGQGAWLGILRATGGPGFDSGMISMIRMAADAIVAALANDASFRELESLAMTDGLTRIPNYRCLREAVEQEIARCLRGNDYFTVVMADVDNLKLYNGAHGHLAGSEILRDLAQILRSNIRRSDFVAKYGGDEFLIVLPRTRPPGGVVLSERIRIRVAERLRGIGGEALSCSFGVAGFPEDGSDFESLLCAADRALYRAKLGGRNAVVCLASGLVSADAPPDRRPEEPELPQAA